MIDKTKPMPTLMLGGPADGKRIMLQAGVRTYSAPSLPTAIQPVMHDAPTDVQDATYVIGTLQGAFGDVRYVGLRNLNDCAISLLIQGYRRQQNEVSTQAEAEHMVTLLGGYHDGRRMAVSDLQTVIEAPEGNYVVVPLVGKDQKQYRVAVQDPMRQCPVSMLIEGYRETAQVPV